MTTMTLEKVAQWHRVQVEFHQNAGHARGMRAHREMADAIEAHLALEASVPDEMTTHDLGGFGAMDEMERGYVDGWNACRAAMLSDQGGGGEG